MRRGRRRRAGRLGTGIAARCLDINARVGHVVQALLGVLRQAAAQQVSHAPLSLGGRALQSGSFPTTGTIVSVTPSPANARRPVSTS